MSEPEGMDRNGGTFDTPNSPKESPAHLSTSHEGQSTYPHPNKSNSNDTSIVSDTDTSMVQNDVTGPESLSVHCEESDKTIESQDGVAKIDQEETSNQSRELKLLLALSKEAKLDTNISRKRKVQPLRKKYRGEGRGKSSRIQYPVTAECELEMDLSSADGSKESMQDDDTLSTSSSGKGTKRKKGDMSSNSGLEEGVKKSRKSLSTDVIVFKPNKDMFCWRCHKDNVNIACETCPRSYHQKCLKQTITDLEHWPCPECVAILKAESTNSRSPALQGMTLEHLCSLLKFAVKRMIQCQGVSFHYLLSIFFSPFISFQSEPFINEVSDNEFPEYKKYIIQPMDLTQLDKNIKENLYGSTQAFEADAKWILHNSIVFNSYQSKLTTAAKLIIKICKQEMSEIENCPSCYLNANTKKKTWFVEVCPKPHLLVWAKLRGFPFWPGKAMKCKDGVVDVRFFGAHDRAWVPEKECFLYSPKDPNLFRVKRADIEQCVEELEIHVDNLRKIYGEFNYPPFKTAIDPDNEVKQLQIFLPMYSSSKTKSLKRQSLDKEQGESKECQELKLKGAISDESFKSTLEEQQTSEKDDDPMEGYGTDDESVPEIDTEFRKTLLHLPENRNDNLEVDEYDTQVPANVEPDTSGTEEVLLTRPVVNDDSKSGSNKSLLEPSSNNSPIGDPAMMSFRRNSDTECTRISDKISRLDIAENVEISLGNDEKGTVSCIENISSSNSECSSDFSVEFKKKPVQVDVDNVEFTISPARKLKMTDTLIKRLSDGECSTSTEENSKLDNVERVKRNFNALDTDETENCASDEIFESKSPSDELLDSVLESSKFVATKIGDSLTKSAQKVAESTVKTVSSGSKNDDKSKNTECVNWTVRDVSQKSDRTKIVIKAVRSEERLDQIGKEGIEEIKDTSEEHQSDAESVIPKAQVVADQQPKESEIGIYVSKSQSDNQEQIETSTHSLYVEEPSIKILLHSMKENSDNVSSNNGAEWALEKKLQSSPDKLKTSKEQVEKKKLPNFHENPTESQKSKSRDHDEVAENEDVRFNIDKVVDNMTKIIDDVAINYSAVREEDRLSHLNKKKPTGTANGSKSDGCEIYVRSFAKIATTVPEINTSMIPTPPSKQKARKSFPQPNYSKVVRPSIHPQPSVSKPSSVESPARVASRPPTAVATAKPIISPLQQIDQVRPTNGYFILQPPQQDNLVFLPPNQTLSYTAPLASLANQVMSVTPCLVSATATGQAVRHITTQAQLWHPGLSQDEKGINPVNLATSQNYIPQGEFGVTPSSITLTNPQNSKVDGNTKRLVNGLIAETPTINLVNSSSEWTASVPSSVASAKPTNTEKPSETAGDSATETALPTITALPVVEPIVIADGDEDFTVLNGLVPDTNISKIISDVILKPLPRLKPRPPGVLSQQFSEGVPSTAGPVAAKINSIAHRVGDYFRGMLIETFEDLSKADNPDATIVNLKLEIESLKYKHSIEISEIERNLTTALKDIQRTILEDRERIVEETRTACEAETIKKVEEAKSKQWCANCSKEAQFYCCWNTSYCDYPCQQKHWSTHMGKCAQSVNPTGQITPSPAIRPGSQQIILRPTNPPAKAGLGRVFSKPVQKVFMNRGLSGSKAMRVQTTTGSLLTMMETTPGNYQLVPSTTVLRAGPTLTIKPNVITVPSANISSTSSSIANQQPQKPKPAVRLIGHSMPVTTALDDDSE
ncbi:MYND-type zinc finger-containing chromatin reader Zmynd8 isoform X9 [Euwallacea fornicatus]|uniref:MYND-type zinc finger-containing chromatin reader Zmynd8 isoform X9 n=1 Tax=Euwallacea fornicatus TaxID=995702 RepID=UPI00338E658E